MAEDTELKNDESKGAESNVAPAIPKKRRWSPIRWITSFVLIMCGVFMTWHIYADRFVPYTDQARIHGLVVPIVPRVSGYITTINVRLHSLVEADSMMFELDKRPFELALKAAEANIDIATQKMGARDATVKSAVARLGVAKAQLDRSQRNYDRTQIVVEENPGALSMTDRDRTETSLAQSIEKVASAEADLEKAQQELGTIGPDNPELRSAIVAMEQAQLDMYYTSVYSPDRGVIESFNVDNGYYAQAGQAIASFISDGDVWIQADMRENNISNMQIGDSVAFTLDVVPGEVYHGLVRSIGFGVSAGKPSNKGELPTIEGSQGWLREPQKFPVIIDLVDVETIKSLRIGGQVDVVVHTQHEHPILDKIGHWQIVLSSWLSYVR